MALIAGFLIFWWVEELFLVPSAHRFVFTDWPVRLTTCSIELTACWCRGWWHSRRCAANCKRTDATFCFTTAAFRTVNLWIHFRKPTKFCKSTCALLTLVFIKRHFSPALNNWKISVLVYHVLCCKSISFSTVLDCRWNFLRLFWINWWETF